MLPWKRINVMLAFHPITLILPNSNSPAIFTHKSNLKPFAHRHTNKSALSLGLLREIGEHTEAETTDENYKNFQRRKK